MENSKVETEEGIFDWLIGGLTFGVIQSRTITVYPCLDDLGISPRNLKKGNSKENSKTTGTQEDIIMRWAFDSKPKGARLYWRIISSIPKQVENSNDTYLSATPFEETRLLDIKGLTYENAKHVSIEIKAVKDGYEEQVKRYNVRQAIDQQTVEGFFEMVKSTE